MNLFERLILRRLMNVAGEGGEGGAPATGNEEQQQGQQEQQTPASLLNSGEPAGQQQGQQPQQQGQQQAPAAFIEKLPDDGDEKAGRIYTRNWAARKKSKTTVLNHRKAAMGHF